MGSHTGRAALRLSPYGSHSGILAPLQSPSQRWRLLLSCVPPSWLGLGLAPPPWPSPLPRSCCFVCAYNIT